MRNPMRALLAPVFLVMALVATASLTMSAAPAAPAAPAGPIAKAASAQAADPTQLPGTPVFVSGTDGYASFRIPAIVTAPDGDLLAFAEGRVNSSADDGNIDMVMKRSTDGGRTWGPLQVVWDDGPNKVGNPTPVVDQMTGQVVLLVIRTDGRFTGTQVSEGVPNWYQSRRPFVLRSSDDGRTWTRPVDITNSVKKRNWRHFVFGPGHALQLTSGPHAGRLVVAGDHSVAPPAGSTDTGAEGKYLGNQIVYSDDHGRTWHLGADDQNYDGVINGNEAQVAQLANGTVYLASRDQNGTAAGNRAYGLSTDGGRTFAGPLRIVPDLVTPVVQGAVLTMMCPGPRHTERASHTLVFSSPNDPSVRQNMSVWTSADDARTWTLDTSVWSGPSQYSDLVQLSSTQVGLLYEGGTVHPAEQILFIPESVTTAAGRSPCARR